ncbi:uncharacterized protein LOC5501722 isoform X2 [Nematostella vectensis]|uniref:uncharacterized protein LOC5501722 isoform X2 n=1 Tax=Nematostella vectensis TaxID=45351 RepID=UPI0020770CDD|nr:uncharacterized protein LOC5501722 isoform X2 [Nematostella vectensis]
MADLLKKTLCSSVYCFGVFFLMINPVLSISYHIDTSAAIIKGGGKNVTGTKEQRYFVGPNQASWNYSVAVFNLTLHKDIFEKENDITINGTDALSIHTRGDFDLRTKLDVSGRQIDASDSKLYFIGGFIRTSNSCCVLGAGPGAGFSYHGGGHGGRGGGFYQDRNTSRYYGWEYHDMGYLLGGSTGTVLFSSKPGSGGGAIEIVTDGKLTVGATISSDGHTSSNTSTPHCAGGSSGGLIRLVANKVVFEGEEGKLSVIGGNSGFSTNHSGHCGGGGGGGVIQVFHRTPDDSQISDRRKMLTSGGKGLANGEDGVRWAGVFFDSGDIEINSSSCQMKWKSVLLHQGAVESRTYNTPNGDAFDYKVCHFKFHSSVHLGKNTNVQVVGDDAIKISSTTGNVEIYCKIDLNAGSGINNVARYRGGFVKNKVDGKHDGPAGVTNCSVTGLYEHDFRALLGGSVCSGASSGDKLASGGGAIELVALDGHVKIGSEITANGYTGDFSLLGGMGGTIRVEGKWVVLDRSAKLSAKPSKGALASGGVIQIKSLYDIEGMCESKIDVTGLRNGLATVMVTAKQSYQVQLIRSGQLTIDTSTRMWIHRAEPNSTIAYAHEGDGIPSRNVTEFQFRVPIIINGSSEVHVTGGPALSIKSSEGMYIGADLHLGKDVNGAYVQGSFIGGFCTHNKAESTGRGPGGGFHGNLTGAGHGGKGGGLIELGGVTYGEDYGYDPVKLIGGSTGGGLGSSLGCGGGAISIESTKNVTIAASITANGFRKQVEAGSSFGGSSGGTIILKGKQVILMDNAQLGVNGSNAHPPGSSATGGGAGGVIVIESSSVIGQLPKPESDARGGEGGVSGENGVVIINGKLSRYPPPGMVRSRNYTGCFRLTGGDAKPLPLMAHDATPTACVLKCLSAGYEEAFIRGKDCKCFIKAQTEEVAEESCNATCPASSRFYCGGKMSEVFSMYRTGYVRPLPTTAPTPRPVDEPTEEFKKLSQKTITSSNSETIVQDLNNLTTNSSLNGGDTWVAVNVLVKLATGKVLATANVTQAKATGQAVIEIASSLMSPENRGSWGLLESRNSTKKASPYTILHSIEQIAMDLGSNLSEQTNVTVETKTIAMGIEVCSLDNFKGGFYPRYDRLTSKWVSDDQIYVPRETVDEFRASGETKTTAVYVLYHGITDLLNTGIWEQNTYLNSKVMAFGFDKVLHKQLQLPVKMTFRKYEDWTNITKTRCSFLDFRQSSAGNWSSSGCKMTSDPDERLAQCECDHLTNFAILMQVHEFKIDRAHEKALQLITYVGCGISLFGLALTLATFLSLETLASERTSIHKNLVVAIGLAQIIFLAGIDAPNPIACKVVALSLHYLYTAAFAWMCCEGVHLYTKVIEVFSSEGSKMKYYYLLGWGAPLIIVIISAAIRFEHYGSEQACWISIKDGLIWAFVGPVLAIMAVNFVVMVMVIKVILASVTSIQNPTNTSQVKAGLKGMVVLLPLLGLTWVFGLMAVDEKTIAFQYIFAILNSLQGLFIFAFHCIGNSEVRVAYKRLHEKRTLQKSLPEHSLSSMQHNKDLKRRMNSRETNSTGDEDVIVTKTIRSVSDVKLSGDHVPMQTFGDTDSGRWSLNCPSPDPFYTATVTTRPTIRSARVTPSYGN